MSTVKATNFSHPSAANPAIVLDAAGGATVAGMGLVLVSPTSIANSGGSASASGGQVTFTGVSSVSLNGVFTSTYQNYRIIHEGTCTSDQNLTARLRITGTDTTASNYNFQRLFANGATVSGGRSTAVSQASIGAVMANYSFNIIDIANPQLSKPTVARTVGGGSESGIFLLDSLWAYTLSTSFDGITIYPDAGTITGTLRVYGYKNS